MSVLIKGMPMPKSCGECFFYDNGCCSVTMYIVLLKRGEDKPKWCPLVEVNPCDTCYIAQNYNLEDDDTPCQNCEEPDD